MSSIIGEYKLSWSIFQRDGTTGTENLFRIEAEHLGTKVLLISDVHQEEIGRLTNHLFGSVEEISRGFKAAFEPKRRDVSITLENGPSGLVLGFIMKTELKNFTFSIPLHPQNVDSEARFEQTAKELYQKVEELKKTILVLEAKNQALESELKSSSRNTTDRASTLKARLECFFKCTPEGLLDVILTVVEGQHYKSLAGENLRALLKPILLIEIYSGQLESKRDASGCGLGSVCYNFDMSVLWISCDSYTFLKDDETPFFETLTRIGFVVQKEQALSPLNVVGLPPFPTTSTSERKDGSLGAIADVLDSRSSEQM
jgi:hypothetical protein